MLQRPASKTPLPRSASRAPARPPARTAKKSKIHPAAGAAEPIGKSVVVSVFKSLGEEKMNATDTITLIEAMQGSITCLERAFIGGTGYEGCFQAPMLHCIASMSMITSCLAQISLVHCRVHENHKVVLCMIVASHDLKMFHNHESPQSSRAQQSDAKHGCARKCNVLAGVQIMHCKILRLYMVNVIPG